MCNDFFQKYVHLDGVHNKQVHERPAGIALVDVRDVDRVLFEELPCPLFSVARCDLFSSADERILAAFDKDITLVIFVEGSEVFDEGIAVAVEEVLDSVFRAVFEQHMAFVAVPSSDSVGVVCWHGSRNRR
jgi:rhodanese-related sulfurtransferase